MKRTRRTAQKTTKIWIESLNEIKSLIDFGNVISIHSLLRQKNITNRWLTFLKENNIVFKQNGYYKWNEKIPVSHKLIERFREYSKSINLMNRKQQSNLFDMLTLARPKPSNIRKTREQKIKFQLNEKPKSELGIIRKFLKWLW